MNFFMSSICHISAEKPPVGGWSRQRCGLKTAEITFRTAAAEEIIRQASNKYSDLVIGAGTILTVEDLHRAFNAGAQFAVAPGFNPVVVQEAVANGYAFFPGVATPSEVEQAVCSAGDAADSEVVEVVGRVRRRGAPSLSAIG